MYKAAAFAIVILGVSIFLLKDEIDQVKNGLQAITTINKKLDELNKNLEKFKLRLDTVEADNKKFQESTARFIQNSTTMLMELKHGNSNAK